METASDRKYSGYIGCERRRQLVCYRVWRVNCRHYWLMSQVHPVRARLQPSLYGINTIVRHASRILSLLNYG